MLRASRGSRCGVTEVVMDRATMELWLRSWVSSGGAAVVPVERLQHQHASATASTSAALYVPVALRMLRPSASTAKVFGCPGRLDDLGSL